MALNTDTALELVLQKALNSELVGYEIVSRQVVHEGSSAYLVSSVQRPGHPEERRDRIVVKLNDKGESKVEIYFGEG